MSSKFLLDFDSGIYHYPNDTHFTVRKWFVWWWWKQLYIDDYFGFIAHKTNSHSFLFLFFVVFLFCSRFSLVSIFSDNILTISIDYHKNNHHHQHHSALECQCYVIWMPNSKFQFSTDTIKRFTLTFTIIICCDFRFMWKIWFYFCLQWRLLRIEMNTLCIGKQKKDEKRK